MDFIYYNLDDAASLIDTMFRENSKRGFERSLLPTYRDIRKNNKFYGFGDYLIMSFVLDRSIYHKKEVNKSMVNRVCRQSSEYRFISKREKMRWGDNLMTHVGEHENPQIRRVAVKKYKKV